MKKCLSFASLLFICSTSLLAQATNPVPNPTYPQIKEYIFLISPIVTFDKNGHTYNFSKGTSAFSIPIGINIYKSDKIGFSFEMSPTLTVAHDTAKITNFSFDPGIFFRFKHDFTYLTRIAFETGGRFGFTPVFIKTLAKWSGQSFFVAIPVPVRFGAGKPASVALALQFGYIF